MASIGVWEYDLLKCELRWTDAVYDLFELPRGMAITRADAIRFYSAESRVEMEALRSQAIEMGGSFSIDIEVRTSRGTPKWINLTAVVEQEDGISVRIFGTKQDITERKEAQEQIRVLQSERIHESSRIAMGSMAATLAHELNQPFAAIANYATGVDNLLRPMNIPEVAADGLKQIAANALRAGEIIRRMRNMIERRRSKNETFDLANVLKEAAASAGRGTSKTAFNLQFKHSGTAAADPVQVMQVAVNIIRNACEAMEGSRRQEVSVRTHDAGNFIVVTIADSGPGLPLELKLFEPTSSAKPNGMGIGLSICRTIVEAHGGKIWSTSTTAGASFFFSLPRIDALRR